MAIVPSLLLAIIQLDQVAAHVLKDIQAMASEQEVALILTSVKRKMGDVTIIQPAPTLSAVVFAIVPLDFGAMVLALKAASILMNA